ncbi:MAG TPA: glycosyltransferase family 39 protein [Chloroflexota bacterium]|nr:glycosyltransferase family 39 protein [Chloroflexota bacterium]
MLRSGRGFGLLLAGLTLAALALRLWRLPALGGFDWDEAATVYIAARPVPDMLSYLRGAPFEHPPLYYLLAHAWLALGQDEAVLRSLSALLGALAVPLLGLLGAALYGRGVGLLAAALLAAAPAHVFYSRDARMYPLLTLLVLVAVYALVRATGTSAPAAAGRGGAVARGVGWWALWGGAALAALATHYYAAFALGGQALYLLASRPRDRRVWLALGAVGAATGAVLAGWWTVAPGLRHSLGGLRPAPLAPDDAALSLWRAVGGLLRGPFAEEPAAPEEAAAALGLALLAALAVLAWRRSRPGGRLLVMAGLAPLLGLAALMLVGRDLNVRFLLMLLPLALLALAAGAAALRPRGWALAGVAVAWALVVVPWFVPYYRDYVRGDYAEALRAVEAAEQPGEAVVFNGPWQTLLFDHYYRGHLPAHILTGAVPLVEGDVASALSALASRYQGFWLLETDMGHADPTGFVPRWLARHAYRAEEVGFRQVRLAHFLLGAGALADTRVERDVGEVALERLGVDPDGPRPGHAARIELVWHVEGPFDAGLKAALRLRDAQGRAWWGEDPWLDAGWLGAQPPGSGDRLWTRAAITLPADAPAGPYSLEVVVYRSTAHPESGEGWVAWSAPPLLLPLGPTPGREVAAAPRAFR